jgi:hypothetical protein
MRSDFISCAVAIAVLLLAIQQVNAQPRVDQNYVAREFLFLINENSYQAASDLFHYPVFYTTEKEKEEVESVKQGLEKYKEAFGNIVETGDSVPDADYIGVGVSGADIAYWEQYEGTISQIMVAANFENLGWGVLNIGFIENNNAWEIQGVSYSIIATDETRQMMGRLIEPDIK